MKNRIQLLLMTVLLMLPVVSLAAASTAEQSQPVSTVPHAIAEKPEHTSWLVGFNKGAVQQTEKKQVGSGAGRLLLGLMTVIGLIFGLAFVVKKTGYAGMARGNQLKIINVLPVGHKEKLMLVKVHGKYFLLGVTAHSVNKIDELQAEEVEDEGEERREQQKGQQGSRSDLSHWLALLGIKKQNQLKDSLIHSKDVMPNDAKKFSDYIKEATGTSSKES